MTKGTKIFRITICVLLSLAIIWGVLCGAALIFGAKNLVLTAGYDIYVADVPVRPTNADDVLGDGTVYGAKINAKIDAIGGTYNRSED